MATQKSLFVSVKVRAGSKKNNRTSFELMLGKSTFHLHDLLIIDTNDSYLLNNKELCSTKHFTLTFALSYEDCNKYKNVAYGQNGGVWLLY